MKIICTSFKEYVTSTYGVRLRNDALDLIKSSLVNETDLCTQELEIKNLQACWDKIIGISEYIYFTLKWTYEVFSSRKHTFFTSYRVSLALDSFILEPFSFVETIDCVVLDEFLIPQINLTNEGRDSIANEIIKKIYKEEFPTNGILKAEDFANKLQLTILRCDIKNWNENIMGAIVFSPTNFEIRDDILSPYNPRTIDGGTILINAKASYERGLGSENNTIVHECVHWLLHWRIALFYRMQNPQKGNSFVCSSDKEFNHVIKLIEKQANALAPRILMPTEPFKKETQLKFHNLTSVRNMFTDREEGKLLDVDLVDKYLIAELSSIYKVSAWSVKIRLIETGFTLARGTKIYVDNAYVRPYSFSPNSLTQYETFTISLNDYHNLLLKNKAFREQLETGAYMFVENHVVLASFQSVKFDYDKYVLTEKARQHLNLYALKFSVKRKGRADTDLDTEVSYLLRLPTISVQESLAYLTSSNANTMKQAEEKKKLWLAFYYKQPSAWNIAFKAIMDEQDIKIIDLSRLCEIDYDTLQKNLSADPKHHISKRVFTTICFGVGIPFCVSKRLLQNIGYLYFDESIAEDSCYMQILVGYIGATWADCNEYLISCGIEPFTSERKPIIKTEKMDTKNPKRLLDYNKARGY